MRRRYVQAAMSGDVWLVPGDLHFPHQDKAAVRAMCDWWDRHPGRRGVVLQGDTLDCWGLSRYPKAAARLWRDSRLQDEVDSARPFLEWAGGMPLGCKMLLGNHEDRLARALDDVPAVSGCRVEFGQITGLDQVPGLEILDHGARVVLGDKVVICHGDTDRFPRRAYQVAAKYPNQVTVWGHTHQVSSHLTTVYAADGSPQVCGAYNVGHLSDLDSADYTDDPSWQLGFATVEFFGDRPLFRVRQHLVVRGKDGVPHVV